MKGYFEYDVEVQWDGSNSLPAMMERDCLVEVEFKLHGAKETGVAGRFNWMMVKSYKVIDDRYNHFDLGELPPVGFTQNECEVIGTFYDTFAEFKVVAHEQEHAIVVVTKYKNGDRGCWPFALRSHHLRPIRPEREKFIEAAVKVAEEHNRSGAKELYGALFDAGFKAPEQQ